MLEPERGKHVGRSGILYRGSRRDPANTFKAVTSHAADIRHAPIAFGVSSQFDVLARRVVVQNNDPNLLSVLLDNQPDERIGDMNT